MPTKKKAGSFLHLPEKAKKCRSNEADLRLVLAEFANGL
jgi:hypothetical protein